MDPQGVYGLVRGNSCLHLRYQPFYSHVRWDKSSVCWSHWKPLTEMPLPWAVHTWVYGLFQAWGNLCQSCFVWEMNRWDCLSVTAWCKPAKTHKTSSLWISMGKLPSPGYHWYLCRQLPKTLNKFVDLANSLQLPNDVMTNVAGPNVPGAGCLSGISRQFFPVSNREADNDRESARNDSNFRQVCWWQWAGVVEYILARCLPLLKHWRYQHAGFCARGANGRTLRSL